MTWQIWMFIAYISGSLFFIVGSAIGLLLQLGVIK